MYADFLEELRKLRLRTARFRRVALHVHSPDSHDWAKCECDKIANERSQFCEDESGLDRFIAKLDPHFDCVAVSDHMKCGLAADLAARTLGSDDLLILPGMEVNLQLEPILNGSRIHVLAIFPEGTDTHHISQLFEGMSDIPADDAKRTGNEVVTGKSLKEWTKRVRDNDGVSIAAHIENSLGVRHCFRQGARDVLRLIRDEEPREIEQDEGIPDSLRNYLFEAQFDAIEIHRAADAKHYRWLFDPDERFPPIATILTSDPHCIEQFSRPDRTTHIKMTKLGLRGLQDAFRFPDTRIRFPDDLPSPTAPRILGIRIRGEGEAFFEDLNVALAENLTCVIGVRGSGKSTLVEALRYTFGYNRTLGKLGKLADSIRELQNTNLRDSRIEVVYLTRSGDTRILEATFDQKMEYVTQVFSDDGTKIPVTNLETCGDYPLRLFGWSEIETLGRELDKQRDLLDLLVPDLRPLLSKRDELRAKLVENRAEVEKCAAEAKATYDRDNRKIERFKEYEADYEKYNTVEVRELCSALDLVDAKQSILTRLSEHVDKAEKSLSEKPSLSFTPDLPDLLGGGGEKLQSWWEDISTAVLNYAEFEKKVIVLLDQARAEATALKGRLSEQSVKVSEEVDEVNSELRGKVSIDDTIQRHTDLRANARRRLEDARSIREEYLEKLAAIRQALQIRDDIGKELDGTQKEISDARAEHHGVMESDLNQFLPESSKVSIRHVTGGDTARLGDGIYKICGAKTNNAKTIRYVLERHGTPLSVARMIRSEDASPTISESAEANGKSWLFTEEVASYFLEKTRVFEKSEGADVDVLSADGRNLTSMLMIEEIVWDDHEAILLNGRPVSEKSPGQRSSAMLPLIALAETTPLVIDQPEDNLDKRLVGTVLRNILAKLKEHRQIIVCTHDPNILVGGDAEQVVVLDAESDRKGKVDRHGSIDNDDIVEIVISLLEGGAEAFEERRRRYFPD
jgi:ABC-type cobalamin/Fe3+-siderophores transport system ATPase subunit